MNAFKKGEIWNRVGLGLTTLLIYLGLGAIGYATINTLHGAFKGYMDRWEKLVYILFFLGLHTLTYVVATVIATMFKQKSLDWQFGQMGDAQLDQIIASIEATKEERGKK